MQKFFAGTIGLVIAMTAFSPVFVQAATLTATNVQPSSLLQGASVSVTITFTTATAIPSTGKIKVTFPPGFNVSAVNGGTCPTMDGGCLRHLFQDR